MEQQNFDTELFIDEVQRRPAIWDMESSEYKNRVTKKRSWEELVELFADPEETIEKKKNLGKYHLFIIKCAYFRFGHLAIVVYLHQIRSKLQICLLLKQRLN